MSNEQNLSGVKMTKQEIFDIVWNSIISQGGPSVNTFNGCAYRGNNGRKCAAGWLIPDEDYNTNYEGQVVSRYIKNSVTDYFKSRDLDICFIIKLQGIHDNTWCKNDSDEEFIDLWKRQMYDLAQNEKLVMPS